MFSHIFTNANSTRDLDSDDEPIIESSHPRPVNVIIEEPD